MKLQPGTEVTPNVRLEQQIATGAMGSVWLAEHLTLNTKVAVKFISDRLDPDNPEVLERFVREASTAAQIKSSHVVQTFDQGVMRDGTPYIVMEFLEGVGLGERLQREGIIPPAQVQRIVQQTAKALQSAHKLGIVHRDIKPDNIFLATHDDELHIKVFDFGIAKHRREATSRRTLPGENLESQPELGLTNDGVMIGTPEYMSPEQVMSAASVDHHADLWGLTVVAYVCLTGKLPFTGADVGELCVNLLEATFAPATSHRPDLPATLDRFFAKALARDPSNRFQSARELAAAFALAIPTPSQDALASGPFEIRASSPSMLELDDSGRGIRGATFSGTEADAVRTRRLTPSALGLIAAAVVLAGVAIAVVLGDDAPAPAGSTKEGLAAQPAPPPPPAEPTEASPPAPEPGPEVAPSATAEPTATPALQPFPKGFTPRTSSPGWPPSPRTKPAEKPKEPGF